MRLTRAGEYAVRCVLYLSAQKEEEMATRKEIALAMDIPEQFLSKIAQQLSRAGILQIVQGSKGGFRLVVSPEKLSLLDVVEAVTGEILLNDCLLRPDSCARSCVCSVNRVWEKARDQLRNTLRGATFAGLLKEEHCFTPLRSPDNR